MPEEHMTEELDAFVSALSRRYLVTSETNPITLIDQMIAAKCVEMKYIHGLTLNLFIHDCVVYNSDGEEVYFKEQSVSTLKFFIDKIDRIIR